jgi:hypothetical protein
MSRILGGFLYGIGLLAALIAIWNVHFGDSLILGQILLGFLGLVFAFVFTANLQEHPRLQLATTCGLIVAAFLMIGPAFWQIFGGNIVAVPQIIVAAVGAVLLLICFRMIPR